MTKRVLVAVDGTKASSAALEIACSLADTYDANLGLLCVVAPKDLSDSAIQAGVSEGLLSAPDYGSWHRTTFSSGGSTFYYEEAQRGAYMARVANAVADNIVAQAAAFSKDSGAKAIKTFVRYGDVATAILETAEAENADFIVMGHDQRGRLESLIKGSVAEKVVRSAHCPCLIYSLNKED